MKVPADERGIVKKEYPWFRVWNQILASDKVQLLTSDQFRAWVILLAVANQGDPRGTLPVKLTRVAFHLRCSETEAEATLTDLIAEGLFDRLQDGSIVAHDWDKWQSDRSQGASAIRMRAHRERQRALASSVTCDAVTVTSPVTSHVTSRSISSYELDKDSKSNFNQEEIQKCDITSDVTVTVSHVTPEESKPVPRYPDPDLDPVMIHTGKHDISQDRALDLWRRIWSGWGDESLCLGWYQHQRWFSLDVWLAAFIKAKKQSKGQKRISIGYVEAIAADYDANGIPTEAPPAAETRGINGTRKPKTRAQEFRDEVSAKLAALQATESPELEGHHD